MTWLEFKTSVEAQGLTDNMRVGEIHLNAATQPAAVVVVDPAAPGTVKIVGKY
jgi:hypothetical protein